MICCNRIMNASYQQSQHRLDYAVVKKMQRQLGVCLTFIDLLHAPNYRGRRYIRQGRIFIPLAHPNHRCIIIDKNHTTRYLVQRIYTSSRDKTTINEPEEFYMQIFEGYKHELHKYLIHGFFHLFEMQSYHSYIGFDQLDLTCPKYQQLTTKNIRKRDNIGEVIFCKIAKEQFAQLYYFDHQLNPIMQSKIQLSTRRSNNDFFSYNMTEHTLKDLISSCDISTKVVSYFFDRLMYAYYSNFWFQNTEQKKVKVFKAQNMVSFFRHSKDTLDYSFFNNSLLNVYALIGKCIFSEQKLLIFPIYEHASKHFNLGAILSIQQQIHLFELDPLDAEGKQGCWRDRLELLIGKNANLIKDKIVACDIKALKTLHTKHTDINAPKQALWSPDCAIYTCLYTLLLMEKYGFLELSEEVKARCKGNTTTTELISFMRMFIYNSYKNKDGYLLPAFQKDFSEAFVNNCP